MDRIRFRAQKILGSMTNYREIPPAAEAAPDGLGRLAPREGDAYLGIYENIPGSLEDSIVVTSYGLLVNRAEGGTFIDYSDIESGRFLPPIESGADKLHAASLLLKLTNGQTVEIPVRGGRVKASDVFEFSRFLKHEM